MTNSGRRRAGRPSSSDDVRVSSASNDACSSTRASGAPMQKWTPAPKEMCGLSVRPTSRVSGSAKTAGSWLAEPEQRGDLLPRRHGDPADLDVLGSGALEQLQRGVEAHQLLDRRRQQRRVRAQPRQLVGVGEQREQAVAADVHRRLVPGVEQQDAGGDQLVLGQPVALGVAHGHQVREQVVARAPCVARRSARAGRRRTRRRRARRRPRSAAVRPYSYIFTIALDHGRSSGRSASGTPSSSAMTPTGSSSAIPERTSTGSRPGRALDQPVDQLAGVLLHPRPQPLDVPAGEGGADQPAQPGVVGRLHLQHARCGGSG